MKNLLHIYFKKKLKAFKLFKSLIEVRLKI